MNWQSLAKNWKTTVSAILTVTLSTTAALLAYPPIMRQAKWVAILGAVQIVGKLWIGLIQIDASPIAPTPVRFDDPAPHLTLPLDPNRATGTTKEQS